MRTRLVGALFLLAIPALADERRVLPPLPVMVSLSGPEGLCRSPELLENLNYRFLHVVEAGKGDSLQIRCDEKPDQLTLDVFAGKKGIGRFRVERSPSSRAGTTAYLAAHAVAKDKQVASAAIDAYIAQNSRLVELGARDLFRGDHASAHEFLARSLESELSPAVIYFGLYKAAAERGQPIRAKWYLAAFLRASKKKASELTDEQIAPMAKLIRSGVKDELSRPDEEFNEYQKAVAERNWRVALHRLKLIIREAPWYEPAYVSLADTYKGIGWKRLSRVWGERAGFAGRLNKDEKIGRDIELRADDAP